MVESDEECEREKLVATEDSYDERDATPPPSPVLPISRIQATPPSPVSNKMSSSGAGSMSSKTINKMNLAPPFTFGAMPGPSVANSRFLHVNQKLGNLSRRPSALSDNSNRIPKDSYLAAKMNNMKRDTVSRTKHPAPPNTPDLAHCIPSSTVIDIEAGEPSSSCSQLTTQAMASGSETIHEDKGSSETLKTVSGTGNQADGLSYLQTTRMGHTAVRSVGSSAFLKSLWGNRAHHRSTQHHSFFTDTTDVRQMEHGLLQLLDDFHSGKLRAFAQEGSMEQMQGIREQQERLARMHFDLGARQNLYAPLSEEGIQANQENMRQLMSSLQQLSHSIEKLQCFSTDAEP